MHGSLKGASGLDNLNLGTIGLLVRKLFVVMLSTNNTIVNWFATFEQLLLIPCLNP